MEKIEGQKVASTENVTVDASSSSLPEKVGDGDNKHLINEDAVEEEEEGEGENDNDDCCEASHTKDAVKDPHTEAASVKGPKVVGGGNSVRCITCICPKCGMCTGFVVDAQMPDAQLFAFVNSKKCKGRGCGAPLHAENSFSILGQALEFADSDKWTYVAGVDIHDLRNFYKINCYNLFTKKFNRINSEIRRKAPIDMHRYKRELRHALICINNGARGEHHIPLINNDKDPFEYYYNAPLEYKNTRPSVRSYPPAPPAPIPSPRPSPVPAPVPSPRQSPVPVTVPTPAPVSVVNATAKVDQNANHPVLVLNAVKLISNSLGGKKKLELLISDMKTINENGGLAVFVEAMKYL